MADEQIPYFGHIHAERAHNRGFLPPANPKAVALIEYLIRTYTDEGALVLDNCMGSGTTAVAAIRTGRHYIGFEIDPTYCEIAEQRIREEVKHGNQTK